MKKLSGSIHFVKEIKSEPQGRDLVTLLTAGKPVRETSDFFKKPAALHVEETMVVEEPEPQPPLHTPDNEFTFSQAELSAFEKNANISANKLFDIMSETSLMQAVSLQEAYSKIYAFAEVSGLGEITIDEGIDEFASSISMLSVIQALTKNADLEDRTADLFLDKVTNLLAENSVNRYKNKTHPNSALLARYTRAAGVITEDEQPVSGVTRTLGGLNVNQN